jgi:hypothetical protein
VLGVGAVPVMPVPPVIPVPPVPAPVVPVPALVVPVPAPVVPVPDPVVPLPDPDPLPEPGVGELAENFWGDLVFFFLEFRLTTDVWVLWLVAAGVRPVPPAADAAGAALSANSAMPGIRNRLTRKSSSFVGRRG